MRTSLQTGCALGIALALVLVACKDSEDASFLGQKAPELKVEKWLTLEPDLKGKFVLVDFFATWCQPCIEAIPKLNSLARQFQGQLAVVGVSNESEKEVRKLKQPKIEYAVAIDRNARTYNELKIIHIPHVILLDPDGVVRWEGYPEEEGHELTAAVVQEILNKYGPPAAPSVAH